MKINRAWHLAHPMPSRASLEQRLEWHAEHEVNCGCREMPPGIRKELEARGRIGPTPRSFG